VIFIRKFLIGTRAEYSINPLALATALTLDGTFSIVEKGLEFQLFDSEQEAIDYMKECFPEYRLRLITGNTHLIEPEPIPITCKSDVYFFQLADTKQYKFLTKEQIKQQQDAMKTFTFYFKYAAEKILYYSPQFVLTKGKLHPIQKPAKPGFYGKIYVI